VDHRIDVLGISPSRHTVKAAAPDVLGDGGPQPTVVVDEDPEDLSRGNEAGSVSRLACRACFGFCGDAIDESSCHFRRDTNDPGHKTCGNHSTSGLMLIRVPPRGSPSAKIK
jgi:hypothetical protein